MELNFAVNLTHDFDRFTLYSPKIQIEREIKKLLNENWKIKVLSLCRIIKDSIKNLFYSKKDSLWHYEDWFILEKKYNAKSTCYFYVHPKYKDCSIEDCDYRFDDLIIFNKQKMSIKDCIIKIKSYGCEIGLHGSF